MRIGIDAACWANQRGYGRFTRCLLNALVALDTGDEFVFFVDAQTYAHIQLPPAARCAIVPAMQAPTIAAAAHRRRSFRDMAALATTVARHRLDVFFFPSVYTYAPLWTRAAVILGVHDAIAEDYPELVFPDRRDRRWWTLKSRIARAQATYILTVSQYARARILAHARYAPERIWVVDEAPDPIFRPLGPSEIAPAVLRRYGLKPGDRFLLYMGGVNPHKNLAALADALSELRRHSTHADVRLLIVGDIQHDGFTPGYQVLRQHIHRLGLSDAVTFTGFVADEEVVHLLNSAQALVLPSFAEGFGLPAVEAAACATPIVATRNSPLPELLAGGGLFVDPHQPAQLTQALLALLDQPEARRQMGRVACQQAQRLSWEQSALQLRSQLATLEEQRR